MQKQLFSKKGIEMSEERKADNWDGLGVPNGLNVRQPSGIKLILDPSMKPDSFEVVKEAEYQDINIEGMLSPVATVMLTSTVVACGVTVFKRIEKRMAEDAEGYCSDYSVPELRAERENLINVIRNYQKEVKKIEKLIKRIKDQNRRGLSDEDKAYQRNG